ncbi:MAG: bifunctional [glutamate--ammonia ligase]-adenylyl-L-tyrosine phosphorylase/[glutamate--ammonia-ligase] adenylyltransferase [Gammaproteobacteria bacterium]|nr:bifunctional [glutamate--ammonia ligase]-adenylyl-L-tyrosine phosphorylase/[glutamate--ammonia-ligase] adenylyltransferase [Gammaproteobacteria bacterium]
MTAAWSALGRERYLELSAWGDLPGDAERVLGASEFVYRNCKADCALSERLLAGDFLTRSLEVGEIVELVQAQAQAAGDEADLMRRLRRLRKLHMVRIAWRDIGALAPFSSVVQETTWLADVIIDAALARLYEWATASRGTPCDAHGNPQHLIVLALGKLGARELNFSSDIDLIFAFAEHGQTRGAGRSESNDEFFERLARRLIRVLDHTDRDGYVYRVDMRLRPFGDSGPLVTSVAAVEDYYQTHGRDWERYALIRARVVAGDRTAGEQLLHTLQPFIYRRYLDFGALESMREMKALINTEVKRHELEHNVKLGPGGIREIEFITQAFQLIRGGRYTQLRSGEVLSVLPRLIALNLLTEGASCQLEEAYRFLRTLEHRLQQVDDHQVHVLPEHAQARERIAFAMGLHGWPALQIELDRHRGHVREHFDQVFGPIEEQADAPADPLLALLHLGTGEESAALLAAAGFAVEQIPEALKTVRAVISDSRIRHLPERGRHRLERLFPDLVRAAARAGNGVVTLERVCEVVATVAQRSAYLSLLCERPLALSQLVRLCASSALIASHIRHYPSVLDELLDPRTLYAPLSKSALALEFKHCLELCDPGDLDDEMETLRREKQTNVLRVAAADLIGALALMKVSDHLTEIAEVCVEQALRIAWRDLSARHGVPYCTVEGHRRAARFAVIGYGKLGGEELGYGSDLDLVYLHDSEGIQQQTDGAKAVDNGLFFARLAQRLGHILGTRTSTGVLYEVDLRLRPDGTAGLLVQTLSGFIQYQHEQAWTWEHQALIRARFICGHRELGSAFAGARTDVLRRCRELSALKDDVREMRGRMRAELGGGGGKSRLDLKQDPGCIADIEFIVQFLTLSHAGALGDALQFTDNIRLLEGLVNCGVLRADRAGTLADAYRAYRARVHALALQSEPALVDAQEFADERAQVRRLWAELME